MLDVVERAGESPNELSERLSPDGYTELGKGYLHVLVKKLEQLRAPLIGPEEVLSRDLNVVGVAHRVLYSVTGRLTSPLAPRRDRLAHDVISRPSPSAGARRPLTEPTKAPSERYSDRVRSLSNPARSQLRAAKWRQRDYRSCGVRSASADQARRLRSDDDIASLRVVEEREAHVLTFAPFRLDLDSERLWKQDHEVRLRRKPFAILRFLVQNPRRLVTHGEIVEAVWGKIVTSESLLRTHVHDLRGVLGEGIVETVVGRGYRFVAEIQHVYTDGPRLPESPAQDGSARRVVGRESELDGLRAALRSARERKRGVVFVTGDAGVGKTTLVYLHIERESDQGRLLESEDCVERYRNGQANLSQFSTQMSTFVPQQKIARCRRATTQQAHRAAGIVAPVAGLVRSGHLASAQTTNRRGPHAAGVGGGSRCVECRSTGQHGVRRPAVAGPVARGVHRIPREPARAAATAPRRHLPDRRGASRPPAHQGDGGAHRATRASFPVALESLGVEDVAAYLSRRFSQHAFPPQLAATVHHSTGGNPLFITTLVDELEGKGLLRARDGQWGLSRERGGRGRPAA